MFVGLRLTLVTSLQPFLHISMPTNGSLPLVAISMVKDMEG